MLAYRDTLMALPPRFTAVLVTEPQNRYNLGAVLVRLPTGAKVGYLAPDVGRHFAALVAAREANGAEISIPAQLIPPGDRLDIRALVDLSAVDELPV
jgi:hypothetical protein